MKRAEGIGRSKPGSCRTRRSPWRPETLRPRKNLIDSSKRGAVGNDHQEADQQMKTNIPNESPPFDRKAKRKPCDERQKHKPKRPKRSSEDDGLTPWNAAGQREWSCKQQHQRSPQPEDCCQHRHLASDGSVAARRVHVTVNAFKSGACTMSITEDKARVAACCSQ